MREKIRKKPSLRHIKEEEGALNYRIGQLIKMFEETDLDTPIILTGRDRVIALGALKAHRHREIERIVRIVTKARRR